jgi:hypothetical protein
VSYLFYPSVEEEAKAEIEAEMNEARASLVVELLMLMGWQSIVCAMPSSLLVIHSKIFVTNNFILRYSSTSATNSVAVRY